MCGIVGVIGKVDAAARLVDGLRRLEYRGYDSAGIATLVDGQIERRRAEGKLVNLVSLLDDEPSPGAVGIGHTRWATHGVPNETNAHPHATSRVALVHNGIIENYQELRDELTEKGRAFQSETDTEVVVHLIDEALSTGLSPQEAVAKSLKRLEGAFALAILFANHDNLLIGARRGSPLVVGYGEGEMFLGSDALALAGVTQELTYLEEGDWAVLTRDTVTFYDELGAQVNRPKVITQVSADRIGKGNHRHYMEKEIHEQPVVIGDTLHSFLNQRLKTVTLPPLGIALQDVSRVTISACGTAYYTGMVAKYWFEQLARLPVEVDIASEFRYREAPMPENGLAIFVSQSGETADTLAALRYAKSQGQKILAIVNVPESTIARESDAVILTQAGPEIGVASTKAFTTQLTVLASLAIAFAKARGHLDRAQEARLTLALSELPSRAAEILRFDQEIEKIAQFVGLARDVLYLGRGALYPIALEGALKLKEISYIHAEGYAAGEMKHGPIALIDESVPVVVAAPTDALFDKTASNVEEVMARGGKVVLFTDKAGVERLGHKVTYAVQLPTIDPFVAPILYAIPCQLLAYHTAIFKGTDVDQPRNLAKSVTVE